MDILQWFLSLKAFEAIVIIAVLSSSIGLLFNTFIKKPMDLRLKLKEKIENEKIEIEKSKLTLDERRVNLEEKRMELIEKAIEEAKKGNHTPLALLAKNDEPT